MLSFSEYIKLNRNLFGNLDICEVGSHIGGWVFDECPRTDEPRMVTLEIDGQSAGSGIANLSRGDGYKGFRIPNQRKDLNTLLINQRAKVYLVGNRNELIPVHVYKPLLEELKRTALHIPERGPVAEALTTICVPVGTLAVDESAVIGNDGHIFLFKGSNDVAGLYKLDPVSDGVTRIVSAWIALIDRRAETMAKQGSLYLQLILPEKSTILFKDAPIALGPITPILAALEQHLVPNSVTRNEYQDHYQTAVELLRMLPPETSPPFLRTDSHLSSHGCAAVVGVILDWLLDRQPDLAGQISLARALCEAGAEPTRSVFQGDLSKRFADFPIMEFVEWPDLTFIAESSSRAQQDVIQSPPLNAHMGTHIRWINHDAPIKLRVVAFANSFFERGGGPYGLSWWCKGLFSEFHFVWEAAISSELMLSIQPDLVICQTIERFLHILPADQL